MADDNFQFCYSGAFLFICVQTFFYNVIIINIKIRGGKGWESHWPLLLRK